MTLTTSRRLAKIKELPWYYSAILHLCLPSVLFITAIIYLIGLYTFSYFHLILIPFIFFFLNFMEYGIHKYTFHRIFPGLKFLYNKHTRNHHMLFTDKEMQITNLKEVAYILVPLPTLLVFTGLLASLGFLISLILGLNIALLFLVMSISYTLFYEWTHLYLHIPPTTFGSGWMHRYLSRFHKIHHNTKHMNHWNFNVTLPLWDKILKTLRKDY